MHKKLARPTAATLAAVAALAFNADAAIRVRADAPNAGTAVRPPSINRSAHTNINSFAGEPGSSATPRGNNPAPRRSFDAGIGFAPGQALAPVKVVDVPANDADEAQNPFEPARDVPAPNLNVAPPADQAAPQTPPSDYPETTPSGPDRRALLAASKIRNAQLREDLVAQLKAKGVDVDFENATSLQLNSIRFRMQLADELAEQGLPVQWKNMSVTELYNAKCQIKLAKKIRSCGVSVDWQAHSCQELHDMLGRVKLAHYMRIRGRHVDWRTYTYAELSRMSVER